MNIATSFSIPLTLVVAFCAARAQTSEVKAANPPQLRLELVLPKRTYRLGEPVVLKYQLTSLVDGTLCFPQPAIEVSGSFEGYLAVEVRHLDGVGARDFLIDDVWPRHPDEEQIRADVNNRWIKLGMSEPYRARKLDKTLGLKGSGRWILLGTYNPPHLSARDQDFVISMGCTPPAESSVEAAPVIITVVDSPR